MTPTEAQGVKMSVCVSVCVTVWHYALRSNSRGNLRGQSRGQLRGHSRESSRGHSRESSRGHSRGQSRGHTRAQDRAQKRSEPCPVGACLFWGFKQEAKINQTVLHRDWDNGPRDSIYVVKHSGTNEAWLIADRGGNSSDLCLQCLHPKSRQYRWRWTKYKTPATLCCQSPS